MLVEYPDTADIGLADLEAALSLCLLALCVESGLFANAEGAGGGPRADGAAAAEAVEGFLGGGGGG